jgi:mono/diheme cytochrome c family protein
MKIWSHLAILASLCLLCFSFEPAFAVDNDSAIERGKKLFEKATCAGCHPSGENLLHPNKVLKGPSFANRYKNDADLVKVIRNGVANTGMPAFSKEQLSDSELKEIIAYIRSLTPASLHSTGSPVHKSPKSLSPPKRRL